jgi:hypothetical protein
MTECDMDQDLDCDVRHVYPNPEPCGEDYFQPGDCDDCPRREKCREVD